MVAVTLNTANWWLNFIVTIGFFLGFVWGTFKTINQVKQFLHHRIAIKASDLAAERLANEIEEIKKQYKPNGGSSMRDVVNRIESKLDHVQTNLDKHLGAHEGL
jgi:hypothetical protein